MPFKGFRHSLESREKMSKSKLENPTRYWLGKKRSLEDIEKFRKSHLGQKPSEYTRELNRIRMIGNKNTLGRKASVEERKKLSEIHKGNKSYLWKGGLTEKNKVIRNSFEFRLWREQVYKRDNYTCLICNKRGGYLNADHIKPFSLYPELRFELSNGRTLCIECHRKTDTYGNKLKLSEVYAATQTTK